MGGFGNGGALPKIKPVFVPPLAEFPIPLIREESFDLFVPDAVRNITEEFRHFVNRELQRDLDGERRMIAEVEELEKTFPESLLLACDTSRVADEVRQRQNAFLEKNVVSRARLLQQQCIEKLTQMEQENEACSLAVEKENANVLQFDNVMCVR